MIVAPSPRPPTVLVKDLAGLLSAQAIHVRALEPGERPQDTLGEQGVERQRLICGNQRVTAEQRHEPGDPGRQREFAFGDVFGLDLKRREVGHASRIGELKDVRISFEAWCAQHGLGPEVLAMRGRSRRAILATRMSRLVRRASES